MADSDYQGLMKIYPQAQTPRKSSKLKPLTAEDKAYNHALSKERSKVENIFAKVKTFKMFSITYRNHRKRFGLRMNLIADIINHELGFWFCRKSNMKTRRLPYRKPPSSYVE
ncbi:Mobile element protein [Streptococcus pneumoniae]|nr:Mobile element protein [Streptococcus pneumoniae]KGI31259.1 Mobile element protein [Streptococcus pneumoniae]